MDRRIRRLGIGLVALFGLLFAQLAYVQVFAADDIKGQPANARRQIIAEYKVERGPILTAARAARSWPRACRTRTSASELLFRRLYPDGELYADLTGYYSRIYGRAGLEQAANPYLSGDAPELAISTFTDLILGRTKKGGAVVTTIDANLQAAAAQALGDQPGAVVAMDPRTGDVLALYANPSYDPNTLSNGHGPEHRSTRGTRSTPIPSKPLVSRAKDELFLPGSTGKLITASAALENGSGRSRNGPTPSSSTCRRRSNTLANFGDSLCNGGSAHGDDGRGVQGVVQRHVRRDRLEARRQEHERPGPGLRVLPHRSTRPDRMHGAHDPVRAAVPERALPRAGVLPGQQAAAGVQRRSAWTTCSRTRCTWP